MHDAPGSFFVFSGGSLLVRNAAMMRAGTLYPASVTVSAVVAPCQKAVIRSTTRQAFGNRAFVCRSEWRCARRISTGKEHQEAEYGNND
jgi:hypothetical protein